MPRPLCRVLLAGDVDEHPLVGLGIAQFVPRDPLDDLQIVARFQHAVEFIVLLALLLQLGLQVLQLLLLGGNVHLVEHKARHQITADQGTERD